MVSLVLCLLQHKKKQKRRDRNRLRQTKTDQTISQKQQIRPPDGQDIGMCVCVTRISLVSTSTTKTFFYAYFLQFTTITQYKEKLKFFLLSETKKKTTKINKQP